MASAACCGVSKVFCWGCEAAAFVCGKARNALGSMQHAAITSSARRNFAESVLLSLDFMYFPRSHLDYLLRPPPERAPPCEAPKLDAPRAPLAWALALLDAPPKAPEFRDALSLGTCRFPILFAFPPPPARFAPVLAGRAAAFAPDRFAPAVPRLLAPVCLAFAP